MVLVLDRISKESEAKLAMAHILMLLERYDVAEKLLIEANRPNEALQMRRDLYQWKKALDIANEFCHEAISELALEYALSQEYAGEYHSALELYENAKRANLNEVVGGNSLRKEDMTENENKKRNELIKIEEGIARACIRVGLHEKGVHIANKSESKAFKKQCAEILESLKV